jgi:hypothetical protein
MQLVIDLPSGETVLATGARRVDTFCRNRESQTRKFSTDVPSRFATSR